MSPPRIGVIVHQPLRDALFSREDRDRLNAMGTVRWTDSAQPLTTLQAIETLRDTDIAIGSWKTPTPDETLLSACSNLRLWIHAAGSVKMMFGPQLRQRQLVIASCAPAIAEQVAEYTLGLIITSLKRAWTNARDNCGGPTPKPANAKSPSQATIGVIGASQVGRRVIALLRPLGARIELFDPYVDPRGAAELGATKVNDLVELCGACDLVTLHAPLLPTTRKMLAATHFAAMRDDAILLNTARGGCIDEAALVAELQKGRLFAVLDVTDPEPAAPDHPFRALPNVMLTSHIAGMAEHRIGRQAVDDVAAFLAGRSPALVVTESMLDRMA
jgi:phosphoglycerate dehydrogenase-like enzyme